MALLRAGTLLIAAVAGCSGSSADRDAGSDAGAEQDAAPALPGLTPCPAGWSEVPSDEPGGNLQVEDFDIARLENRVRFENSERNFDSGSLPVPSPATGLPGAD